VSSIGLTSGNNIFGFDGDGIVAYGLPGNGLDSTGYGGPNAYFTNINASATTGVVNFITPIAARGGTGYFSLENALSAATACSSVINSSVTHQVTSGSANQPQITATFTPNIGYTIAQAAQLCGFIEFDWQSLITSWPLPSPLFAAGSATPLYAPPAFNDPPPQGYAYQNPPNAVQLPVYYNLFTPASDPLSLAANVTNNTLSFFDAPADPCLPGGTGAPCGGHTAPGGSYLGFTTHLVGIMGTLPGASVIDTGIGFTWVDTFNGTSGSLAVSNSYLPVDPNSGTGGVTVTSVNDVTTYQYPKSIGVTTINGLPVGSPPPLTLLTGQQITTTASGLAYSRATQTFAGTVTITNISNGIIEGPLQIVFNSLPSGVTLTNATGSFGGFSYITVAGLSSLGPSNSASVTVQFKNPSLAKINFVPLVYTGGFN
jgi:hypothetical protein